MHIVTPEFLTGAPVNVDLAYWQYEWRRQQNLTGLERSHKTYRKLINQTIDNIRIFNWSPNACPTNNCSSVQIRAIGKEYYRRTPNPFDCLTAYSSINGDRSDVIFVSKFDYLWNSSTSIPHMAQEADGEYSIWANASAQPQPVQNSLLFAKYISTLITAGLWHDYYWLCGATNSFDCEYFWGFKSSWPITDSD
jgi:hypothetical protein